MFVLVLGLGLLAAFVLYRGFSPEASSEAFRPEQAAGASSAGDALATTQPNERPKGEPPSPEPTDGEAVERDPLKVPPKGWRSPRFLLSPDCLYA